MKQEVPRDAAAAECLIALGNLRSSALTCVHLLAEKDESILVEAREQMDATITGSGPVRVDRAGSLVDLTSELTGLCGAAEGLIYASRTMEWANETLHLARQRLVNDVFIARSVLVKCGEELSGEGRPSSVPPIPQRRSG